jgi:hypothetical protein
MANSELGRVMAFPMNWVIKEEEKNMITAFL